MNILDVCYATATNLRELYQTRQLSPVEVLRALLDHVEVVEPDVNAFVTKTPDLAIKQARAAEAAYGSAKSAASPPALAGIPVTLKDLTVTRGIRTTRGSLLYKDWVPDYDAPVVERLSEAGAVLLGKTNTPEFGWKGDTSNRVVGSTHNPWRHGRTAGGSSGGAAAAVAAGFGPIAQGSDGAGSVRIPACMCGVYGLKPSWSLIPQYPASPVELLSHLGPLTRSVSDAACMLTVMAGSDVRDRCSLPNDIDFTSALKKEEDLTGLKVAWSPDLGYAAVNPEVGKAVAVAAKRFEELGCDIVEDHPTLEDPWHTVVDVLWSTAFAGLFWSDLESTRDSLDPGLLEVIMAGSKVSGPEIGIAHGSRAEYYHAWQRFMEHYDLVLTPTLPVTAFPAGDHHPGHINETITSYLSWTAFTYPFNITGQPAATVPCGFVDGLPVGLQIVGRWRDDVTVLRASAAFERLAPWAHVRPSFDFRNDD